MIDKLAERYPFLRTAMFRPFVIRTSPDVISAAALAVALIAGMLFYSGWLLLPAALVLLNGFLDALDGEIARNFRRSNLGDFVDHTFDRLADIAILAGIALSGRIDPVLGFSALTAILLVSYLGTASQALTGKRLYAGLISRADRILIIATAAAATVIWQAALYFGILALFLLSAATAVQRFAIISKALTRKR
jgi:phosphatidylglycerophosphate synthase